MASINNHFYKEIRDKYSEMNQSFNTIKNEYLDVNSGDYCNDLFQLMYSMSDFYDFYETMEYKLDSLLKSQTLLTKQDDYEIINEDVLDMLNEIKTMYRDIKSIVEFSGGFSPSEIERLKTFKIDRITY